MPASLSERAYTLIRDEIITLRIPPGAALSEEEMMRRLRMGRTPVREAVRRLALEALVDIYPRRGTFASDIHLTDLSAISEVRIELEGQAAALAARRAGAAQAEQLRALIGQLHEAARRGGEDLLKADADVHRAIYRWTRNRYLEDTLTRYLNLSLRIWYLVLERLPEAADSVQEHEALLLAIDRGQEPEARQLAVAHVARFEEQVRQVM